MRQVVILALILCGSSIDAIPQDARPGEGEVVVAIPSNEEFYIGRDRIERNRVVDTVKSSLGKTPPDRRVVYIKAMCSVHHGVVVSLINDLREAGIDNIGLLAVKQASSRRLPPRSPTDIEPATASSGTEPVVIELLGKGRVKVNSQTVAASRLQAKLLTLLSKRSDKTVFVAAPSGTPYCDIVNIVDTAKAASATPIGLRTQ